jgi:rare lipoprotein A
MSTLRFSAAPLLPGVFARWVPALAVSFLAVGCSSVPFLGNGAKPAAADRPVAAPQAPAHAEPPAAAAAAAAASPVPPRPAATTAAGDPPDAVPRVERISTTLPNLPYRVRGEDYQPHNSDVPMQEAGIASWYGEPFHGRRTATGEVYDMDGMTAAHKTMPLPSYAVVRNRRNGKQIVVRVNDRGPFKDDRVIDLSRAAARKLGFTGLADVEVRRLTHADIRTGAWKQARQALASSGQ